MRKTWRLKAFVAGAAAAVAVSGAASTAHAALCGDSDNSGTVAINDVVQHLQAVTNSNGSAMCGGAGYANCGDLDGSGATLSVVDTQLLLNKVSGIANCASDNCVARTVMANGATLPKPITGNVVVTTGNTALVDGLTFIAAGASLTIQAGATIEGIVEDPPSVIIAKPASGGQPTARVFSQGTDPNAGGQVVTLTSHATPGTRDRQDWGGLVLLGNAPVNLVGAHVEGVPEAPDTVYGGSDANDFSGCLTYTRLYFSGRALTPDNELNTFTFAGIGRQTKLDHLQGHFGFDDALEWFGGTASGTFLMASAEGDDGFDTQLATQHSIQFGLVQQAAATNETPGSNGWEQDDSEFDFNASPPNYPKYCNVTTLGARYDLATNPGTTNQFGILSRRGNSGMGLNSIIKDFRGAGFQLRDPETSRHYCASRSGAKRCVNGPNDGTACLQTAPPYTTCYDVSLSKICVAGPNAGETCSASSECPTSTCASDPDIVCTDAHLAGVCEGGTNHGDQCSTSADCGGGTCATAGSVPPLAFYQGMIFSNNAVPAADNSTCPTNNSPATNPACQCSSTEWYALCKHEGDCITDNSASGGGALDSIGGSSFPRTNFVPTGAAATLVQNSKRVDCSTKDSFFVNAPYIGGFAPGGTDWTTGWTSYPFN